MNARNQNKTIQRSAEGLYQTQNRRIHRAFARLGMPYRDHKETWLSLAADIAGRDVGGLSDLSLGERHELIVHLQGLLAAVGGELYAPAVPRELRGWRKGDLEQTSAPFRKEDDPQARMVWAMWTEMGYRRQSLRGLCWKLFRVQDPRWLDSRQLSHLVNVVQQTAQRKGYGKYLRR